MRRRLEYLRFGKSPLIGDSDNFDDKLSREARRDQIDGQTSRQLRSTPSRLHHNDRSFYS